jgi:hypothetical protein
MENINKEIVIEVLEKLNRGNIVRADSLTIDYKYTAYYVGDNLIRIDIKKLK